MSMTKRKEPPKDPYTGPITRSRAKQLKQSDEANANTEANVANSNLARVVGQEMFDAIAECSSDKAAQIGLLQKMHDLHQEQKFNMDIAYPSKRYLNGYHGGTLLQKAAEKGLLDVVKLLLDWEAQVDASHGDLTPLTFAAQKGHTAVVQLLLEKKAKVDGQAWNYSPLYFASIKGDLETMKALLACKASVNSKNSSGVTFLMQVITSLDPESLGEKIKDILAVLIKYGADVNAETPLGTPLQRIAHHRYAPGYDLIAKALLSNGAILPPYLTSKNEAISKVFTEYRQQIRIEINESLMRFFPSPLTRIIEDYVDPQLTEEQQKPGNK